MDYRSEFYEARYHLDVAGRMFESYDEYGGKRFLVGIVRELACGVGCLVRAFMIMDKVRGGFDVFARKVGPRYLGDKEIDDLGKVLKIERDQKLARVQFEKKDDILMEVDGKWKILRISRLRELFDTVNGVINDFPTSIKR